MYYSFYNKDIQIIFISGREGTLECYNKTFNWLRENILGIYNIADNIFMRKEKDYRSDEIIKKEIFEENIKDKYNVLAVLDDRKKVVDMWRKEGLLCLQVWDGDF